jgi:microsomal dipeptidase-like Zn-dependent dipeptidase
MKNNFAFADLHCHPNLKPFGHSFDQCKDNKKCDVWFYQPPGILTKILNTIAGVTRFSQADFTTLSKGGAKIIFASLYPFEKGFFKNAAGNGYLSAWLSDLVTGIGYKRVRNLQQHVDYYADLEKEYHFFKQSQKSKMINGQEYSWKLASSWTEMEKSLKNEHEISVVLTIEGAHVFNSGLQEFGKSVSEEEVLENIRKVKQWEFPPLFITFAHNFNNEFCGHANSLEPIKSFVDQSKGMNSGFTPLGRKVLQALLSSENGKPIYIDIKHMSIIARKEYFELLTAKYPNNMPPTLVSHGAVNGQKWTNAESPVSSVFYPSDINFYDEEIVHIGKSGGLFAIQFDARRIARKELVSKKLSWLYKNEDPALAAQMIWHQIRHIAEVLDKAGYFGWGIACIGSDYDGTIDPLPGIWTAEYFSSLYDILQKIAGDYLRNQNSLTLLENKVITGEELVDNFFLKNTTRFMQRFY